MQYFAVYGPLGIDASDAIFYREHMVTAGARHFAAS